MAATLLNFSTASQEIPAQEGKIIEIHRIFSSTHASVMGTPRITIQDDITQHIAPPIPVSLTPVDVPFPSEHPLGNRGQAVTIAASASLSATYAWVEWRYVD